MVVAPRQESRPGGRAQTRRVELRVAQTILSQLVEIRGGYGTAECGGL